jgi:hypothetical protein
MFPDVFNMGPVAMPLHLVLSFGLLGGVFLLHGARATKAACFCMESGLLLEILGALAVSVIQSGEIKNLPGPTIQRTSIVIAGAMALGMLLFPVGLWLWGLGASGIRRKIAELEVVASAQREELAGLKTALEFHP